MKYLDCLIKVFCNSHIISLEFLLLKLINPTELYCIISLLYVFNMSISIFQYFLEHQSPEHLHLVLESGLRNLIASVSNDKPLYIVQYVLKQNNDVLKDKPVCPIYEILNFLASKSCATSSDKRKHKFFFLGLNIYSFYFIPLQHCSLCFVLFQGQSCSCGASTITWRNSISIHTYK